MTAVAIHCHASVLRCLDVSRFDIGFEPPEVKTSRRPAKENPDQRASDSDTPVTVMNRRLRAAHVGADVAERTVGCAAERLDRGDADQDDQGQHDGVFHCGRALFGNEKPSDTLGKSAHDFTSMENGRDPLG